MAWSRSRLRELARQFPENGLKFLLENPLNVRDLLGPTRVELLDEIEWPRVVVDRTTYVQRDYRHVEADVVLHGPLRSAKGAGSRQLLIYILIEHQSEPDAWMMLRVVEYVVQIYKAQWRTLRRGSRGSAGRLQLVLPVVVYTGDTPWPSLGRFADLVHGGARFPGLVPDLGPLFINVGTLPQARLETEGGFFGSVLRLVRERHAPAREFRGVLEQVVTRLEGMQATERNRWQELLSYAQALVYHGREEAEQGPLIELIAESAGTGANRKRVIHMGRTIAEALMAKGKRKGRQQGELAGMRKTLLRQLRKRFGDLPAATEEAIKAARSVPTLESWLDRFVDADRLEDVGIAATEDA